MKTDNKGVIAAGLALFSMFFGAGDLIWPLILGGNSGNHYLIAVLGLIITGVSLPLLGLMAMMLFRGDYKKFFGQLGTVGGIIFLCAIQGILGPFGSIPRLITLSFVTIKPYIPFDISFSIFSALTCVAFFLFAIRPKKIVDLLGLILCPCLLVCLGLIIFCGWFPTPPEPKQVMLSSKAVFFEGINVGYSTLDLIASFIFAPVVLSYFRVKEHCDHSKRTVFKKMIKSSLLAGGLLILMFFGLASLAAHHFSNLPPHAPEEGLMTLSRHLLGSKGALFTCLAVTLSCLTTAIPITVVVSKSIQNDIFKGKVSYSMAVGFTLIISMLISNLGFMGIAHMLMPILHIICPTLIVMSIGAILQKVKGFKPLPKKPLLALFLLTVICYFAF